MAYKAKRAPLTDSAKRDVAAYMKKHPTESMAEVSRYFDVSHEQVRKVKRDVEADALKKPARKRKPQKRIAGIKEAMPPDEIMKSQYHQALAELAANVKLGAADRIKLLDTLASIHKTIQQTELQGHMRGTDARMFAGCVRYFMKGATDEDVIKIYHEVRVLLS